MNLERFLMFMVPKRYSGKEQKNKTKQNKTKQNKTRNMLRVK